VQYDDHTMDVTGFVHDPKEQVGHGGWVLSSIHADRHSARTCLQGSVLEFLMLG
jgi:hypothetical protein